MSQVMPPNRDIADDVEYYPGNIKRAVVGNDELFNDVLVVAKRLNSYGTDIQRVEFIMEDKGLGSLPSNVPSVGTLLLFNSSINPYKDYQTLDNLFSSGRYFFKRKKNYFILFLYFQNKDSGGRWKEVSGKRAEHNHKRRCIARYRWIGSHV